MIIDDGYEGRPHRKNLFNNDFQLLGIAIKRDLLYEHVVCLEFGVEMLKKDEPNGLIMKMNKFLEEECDFEIPEDVISYV